MSFLQNLLGLGGAGDSLSQSMGLGGAAQGSASTGGLEPLMGLNLFGVDNSMRLPLALSMMGGGSNSQAFTNAANLMSTMGPKIEEKRAAMNEQNQSVAFLEKFAPDIAEKVRAGYPVKDGLAEYKLRAGGGETTKFGLNPVYMQDEKGNTVLGVLGNDGTMKKIDTGGLSPMNGVDKVDLGTEWGLLDRRTGVITQRVPKNIAGAAAQQELGKAQGQSAASASADFQAASNALDLVDELMTDPNRARGSGASSLGNWIPSTKGYDYQSKVDKAKAGAFLTAIQQLRGMGALSNAEGQVATQAVANLDTAQSEEAFLASLQAYRKIIEQGLQRAASAGGGGGVSTPGAPSGSGGVIDYQDYFKGGN